MASAGPAPESPTPDARGPEFPFARSVCACRRCSICCEHIPGTLVPSDLAAIAAKFGRTDLEAFAREWMLAGDSATIRLADGRVLTLGKLVPRRGADGACVFYEHGRCSIHEVAPFGCRYYDAHMTDAASNQRDYAMSSALLDDIETGGRYTRAVAELRILGKLADPASQASLKAAMRCEGLL